MVLLLVCSCFLSSVLWIVSITDRVTFLVLFAAVSPFYVVAHVLRKSFRLRQSLISDLEHFDLDSVACRVAADKDFVHDAIIEWFGSTNAFLQYVRGDLRRELLSATLRSRIPRAYVVLLSTAPLSASLEGFVGLCRGGAQWRPLLSHLVGHTLGIHLLWWLLSMRFFLYLCNLNFASRPGLLDYLQSLLVFLIFSLFYSLGGAIGYLSYSSNLGAATAFTSVALFLTCTPGTTITGCLSSLLPARMSRHVLSILPLPETRAA